MTNAVLLLIPLIAAGISALMPRNRQNIIEHVAVIATVLEIAFALLIVRDVLSGTGETIALFSADALGAFVVFFTSIVGFSAAMHSVGHLRTEMNKGIIGFSRIRQYYTLFHLFFFAMFAAATTASPIIMWASIEATTLATAFLISFYNKPSALEAGWKHLIVNSTGLLIGFLGTLLFLDVAASAGAGAAFISWDTLHALSGSLNPLLVKIAFVFVLVGYGTKVGLVPMHTWLPDAHSKAPVPISSLLSGVLLNMALVAVLRFRSVADSVVDPSFSQHLLITFGVVSLVVAALIIFGQKNYKRMLAYSSIEHMGIMTLGFGIGGAATVAALFHMLYHALLKPILFFCAGNFFLKYGSTKISDVRGALTLLPFTAVTFFAALLAISGIPPSGIFFTKLSILAEGIQHFPYVMMIVLAALAIVLAGFLRSASSMLFSEPPQGMTKGGISHWNIFSIGFLSILFIALSFHAPATLSTLITNAASLIH